MVTGHVTTLGPLRHKVTLCFGLDERGKRIRRSETFRGTRRAADRYCTDLVARYNRGEHVEPTRTTFGEHLDTWLGYVGLRLRPSTVYGYRYLVKRYVKPHLGHIRLDRLHPRLLSEFYAQLAEGGRARQVGGLSPRTLELIHCVIHASLQLAVTWGMIPKNVAKAVSPYEPGEPKFRALDEAELVHLLGVLETAGPRDHALSSLAGHTGLRLGECLALRRSDLELGIVVHDADGREVRCGAVTVNRTVSRVGASEVSTGKPKTRAGRRRVIFMGEPVKVMERYLEHLALRLGRELVGDDLVFPAADGALEKPWNFRKRWARLVAKAGFRGLRFHDLRHTHATQLIRRNVHLKVIQDRLGHETIKTTMDTYGHLLPGMDLEAALAVDMALSRARAEAPRALPPAGGSVGDRIRRAREARGLTGADLARLLGLAKSSVSMIELGRVEVHEQRLGRIATVLGVSREWLEGGEGQEWP